MSGLPYVQARAQETDLHWEKLNWCLRWIIAAAPAYEVSYNNKPIILPSHLGFKLNTDSLFYNSFKMNGTARNSFDQTWQTVWGETKDIRNHYEELTVHLQSSTQAGSCSISSSGFLKMVLGFRYEFPASARIEIFYCYR